MVQFVSKYRVSLIALGLLCVILVSCGAQEDRASVRRGRDARQGNIATPDQQDYSTGAWSGIIYGSPQNLFQEATEDFVSSFMNPTQLGTVSGAYNQPTGVRFSAQLNTTGFNGTNVSGLSASSGNLYLLIWDSQVSSGQEPIVISSLQLAGVYPQNNGYIDLHFDDNYGAIGLMGTIQGNNFVGHIRFQNHTHYNDGTPAAWDPWGGFSIPKCQIFRCN